MYKNLGLYSEISNGDSDYHLKCLEIWEDYGAKKVVVKVNSYDALKEIYNQCKNNNIPAYMVADAGRTQIDPGTVTVLGIGPGKLIIIKFRRCKRQN